MRISDWSSDVCSSDLVDRARHGIEIDHAFRLYPQIPLARNTCPASGQRLMRRRTMTGKTVVREGNAEIDTNIRAVLRSEERSVGKKCGSTCRTRRTPHQ